MTADETHLNLNSLPHHHTMGYTNTKERLNFGPQDKKSGLRAMPEGTERKAKERQVQNWPGKNLLPNFRMKMKVVLFVFTNH